jgi:hypothetical protein
LGHHKHGQPVFGLWDIYSLRYGGKFFSEGCFFFFFEITKQFPPKEIKSVVVEVSSDGVVCNGLWDGIYDPI